MELNPSKSFLRNDLSIGQQYLEKFKSLGENSRVLEINFQVYLPLN